MKTRAKFLTLIAATAGIFGCGSSPLGVADRQGGVAGGAPSLSAQAQTTNRTAITGTVANVGVGDPDRLVTTPSGRCHLFNVAVYNFFNGDVVGPVTFHENEQATCNFSDVVGSGPFDGPVSWNGRTGTISGQWTTNCTTDPSQPIGLSCGGVMNARGSGGLEGVLFHFEWGPGWYPFAYTGTAIAQQ
jgi:hypothetical protein